MIKQILLTNDDSHASPLLALIVTRLSKIAELSVVVPKHEQSWKGKSMTRFGSVHAEQIEIAGLKAWAVSGTPADCVCIGMQYLCKRRPDLVVSGINAGLNSGISFVLSSGTVGACFEANIAGIPAIAISQAFETPLKNRYTSEYDLSSDVIERLDRQSRAPLDHIFSRLLSSPKLLSEPVTWNINLPWNISYGVAPTLTSLGKTFYEDCFKRSESGYEHSLSLIHRDQRAHSDTQTLARGEVSLSKIDIRKFGQSSEDDLAELQMEFV